MLISWALHRSRDATMHVGKLVASRFAQADEADLEVATDAKFMEVGRGPCEKAETANGVCASMLRDESLTPAQRLDMPGDADAIALRTTVGIQWEAS